MDLISLMRHTVSAHAKARELGGKPGAIEKFFLNIRELGIPRAGFTRLLVDIAAYLVPQVSEALGRQGSRRLTLLGLYTLQTLANAHNKAKETMDQLISGALSLTTETIEPAIGKLETSARLLIPTNVRPWALLVFTHLSQAYAFGDRANPDRVQVFRSLAAVETSRIWLHESSPPQHRALVLFNLGTAYHKAGPSLGRLSCWRVALQYFEELLGTIPPGDAGACYRHAARQATILAIKLGRIRTAMRFLRLHRSLSAEANERTSETR
jgi:hypothetical protein